MARRRLYGLTWLAEQSAARWRRTEWDINIAMDELWTVMSRLRDAEQPTVEVPQEDGGTDTEDNLTIEQIETLIRELQPPPVIEPGPDPSFTVVSRIEWRRYALPTRVDSFIGLGEDVEGEASTQYYQCTMYPFGDMDILDPTDEPSDTRRGGFTTVPAEQSIQRECLQLQLFEMEEIPSGTWTIGSLIRQLRFTELKRDGATINTTISVLQEAGYIQVPVWL
jgi:hypothetical protein